METITCPLTLSNRSTRAVSVESHRARAELYSKLVGQPHMCSTILLHHLQAGAPAASANRGRSRSFCSARSPRSTNLTVQNIDRRSWSVSSGFCTVSVTYKGKMPTKALTESAQLPLESLAPAFQVRSGLHILFLLRHKEWFPHALSPPLMIQVMLIMRIRWPGFGECIMHTPSTDGLRRAQKHLMQLPEPLTGRQVSLDDFKDASALLIIFMCAFSLKNKS